MFLPCEKKCRCVDERKLNGDSITSRVDIKKIIGEMNRGVKIKKTIEISAWPFTGTL